MENNRPLVRPALRPFFQILGAASFVLGVLGAFLPILPTTPFLILSAFCFSKSSRRVHQWLLNLPTFGPMIKDWENNRVIRPKAKIWAIAMLSALIWLSVLLAEIHILLKGALLAIWASVSLFIAFQKSR
ncbi:MAG: YbaN family protein [Bacteriovoracaceae bacterium]